MVVLVCILCYLPLSRKLSGTWRVESRAELQMLNSSLCVCVREKIRDTLIPITDVVLFISHCELVCINSIKQAV